MHIRGADIVLAVIGLGVMAHHTHGQAPYIMSIGDLPGGDNYSEVADMTPDGRVIVGTGSAQCDNFSSLCKVFRWTAETGMVGLNDMPGGNGRCEAHAVSADGGVIVGSGNIWYDDNLVRHELAFRSEGDQLVALPLPEGMTSSVAFDVSGDGTVIVLQAWNDDETIRGSYRWTADDGLTPLTGPPGTQVLMTVVSRDGSTIAGCTLFTGYNVRPSYWRAAEGLKQINSQASAVVTALTSDGSIMAGVHGGMGFIWSSADGWRELGAPHRALWPKPSAITPDGSVIVGNSSGSSHPFIWDQFHHIRQLTPILYEQGMPYGFYTEIEHVSAISDDGRTVVGDGPVGALFNEGIVTRLSIRGDGNGDGVVDVVDLLEVIWYWGDECGMTFVPPNMFIYDLCWTNPAPPPLGDDRVDVADLLSVILHWTG